MSKWGKLYSNVWFRIADENFNTLLKIQKNYQLRSVEEVLELLVNKHTIDCLANESEEYVSERNLKFRSKVS